MRNQFTGPCHTCGTTVHAGGGRIKFLRGVPQGAQHFACGPQAFPQHTPDAAGVAIVTARLLASRGIVR